MITVGFDVVHPESKQTITWINPTLAVRNKLTDDDIIELKALHVQTFDLFSKMLVATDKQVLRDLNNQYRELEFKKQKIWGFPENANFHRWWEVPLCECPKSENRENYGTNFRTINVRCRIHGD